MCRACDDGIRVLVGTDIPALRASYVERALAALRIAEVVVGPTEDGGYCLIGMNSPRPELFEGIAWGTAEVLTSTLRAAGSLRVEVLEEIWDLDDVEDLTRWQTRDAGA